MGASMKSIAVSKYETLKQPKVSFGGNKFFAPSAPRMMQPPQAFNRNIEYLRKDLNQIGGELERLEYKV